MSVIFAVLAWWASTGAVLALVWAPRRFALPIALAATALAPLALALAGASDELGGFFCALTLWGWQELLFLLGFVTGPRREPMSAGARGVGRFFEATRAVIHHEFALVATGLALAAFAFGSIAPRVFALLWVMRLAAKLNLFFGVTRTSDELVPRHLRYLTSYFRRDRATALLPLTVAAAVWLAYATREQPLLATMAALGALEHVFLLVPLPDAKLWRWVLPRGASVDCDFPVANSACTQIKGAVKTVAEEGPEVEAHG